MKNRLVLAFSLLALPATTSLAQLAKAPPAPGAPPKPAQVAEPAPPATPAQALADTAMSVAREAQKAARDAIEQARGMDYRVAVSASAANAPGRNLVIPHDAADVKSIADTEEDLNIMAHILDKAVSGPDGKTHRAMGIAVRGPFEAAVPRNLYLDGYGAIFFLAVNFPFSAPPPGTEEAEAKPEPPSEWDEARREIYHPPQTGFEFKWPQGGAGAGAWVPEVFGGGEEYDAAKVEQLQKSLIGEMKNAAHIRNLKSHETVTLVVMGRGPGSEPKVLTRRSSAGGGGFGGGSGGGGGGFGGGARSSATTTIVHPGSPENRGNTLIIRADKSDLEAFQKDNLSYDEFRKKVTVLTY